MWQKERTLILSKVFDLTREIGKGPKQKQKIVARYSFLCFRRKGEMSLKGIKAALSLSKGIIRSVGLPFDYDFTYESY